MRQSQLQAAVAVSWALKALPLSSLQALAEAYEKLKAVAGHQPWTETAKLLRSTDCASKPTKAFGQSFAWLHMSKFTAKALDRKRAPEGKQIEKKGL